MKQTSTGLVLAWGVIGLVLSVGFHFVWESMGRVLPALPWTAVLGMLVLSLVLVLLGWPVKKWRDGDRSTEIDQVQAARTAVLAKAALLAGSLLTGWYLGAVVHLLVSAPGVRVDAALVGLVPVGAAAVLMVTGLVVESWCTLPPGDGPADGRRGGRGGPGSGAPEPA
ncbi:DUF3180 domain-containing protein [Brevibacterium litoralis]|uniref:DUF3180 domain-containing protein n=1 Tax=Brevibacterium litoralis TaxID=3138935 RepID=UPI0032EB6745